MSLKKVFSDISEKTCRENVVGALVLSALAVFGFARTASALSQISTKPATTDSVSIIPREKAEKIAISTGAAEKSAEKTLATSYKTGVTAQNRATSTRVATGTAGSTVTNSAATNTGSYITIAGANIPLFAAGNTSVNPGSNAASYGRLIYGHRGTAFGNIASLPAGSSFTIARNGAAENYVVAGVIALDRATTARFMYSLVNQASYKGQTYSLILMTCAGAPGDNGDASHRTIVFANRV